MDTKTEITAPARKIALAADHAGFALKKALVDELRAMNFRIVDLGSHSEEASDYPGFAHKMAKMITDGGVERGVLVCGSGLGMSIAANRHKGIRAALCRDEDTARLARKHNDANILVLPGRFINENTAKRCLKEYLTADFEGGRHQKRVEGIDDF